MITMITDNGITRIHCASEMKGGDTMALQRYLTVDTDGVVYDWSEFKAAYQYCIILSDSNQFSTFIDTEQHFMIGNIDALIAYKENHAI